MYLHINKYDRNETDLWSDENSSPPRLTPKENK